MCLCIFSLSKYWNSFFFVFFAQFVCRSCLSVLNIFLRFFELGWANFSYFNQIYFANTYYTEEKFNFLCVKTFNVARFVRIEFAFALFQRHYLKHFPLEKKPSMKVKRKNEEQNYACAFFWLNKVSIFHSFRNACIHLYISHTENSTFATVMQKHQMCPVQHMPSKQKKKNHRKLHGNWIQWVKKKEKRTEWELANF